MTDKVIEWVLERIFSVPSLYIHTVWFIVWFAVKLDISLLTNIVSLEAIYIGLLVGIQQLGHHKAIKKHFNKEKKND